jgi:hypothetical protein
MIQFKRGKTTSWLKNKTKLSAGQPGYDKDKHKIKIGDGEKSWAELPYASGLSSEEILSSEREAKIRRNAAKLINPLAALMDSPAIITYGKESPDKDTVGQLYLQTYDAEPEVDYVVEIGTDGIWTYRKWKSGLAECWGTFDLYTSIKNTFDNTNTSLYYNENNTEKIKYPFSFVKIPYESATLQSSGGLTWLVGKAKNSKDKSGEYRVLSPEELDSNTYSIMLHVKGHWK